MNTRSRFEAYPVPLLGLIAFIVAGSYAGWLDAAAVALICYAVAFATAWLVHLLTSREQKENHRDD